MPTLLKNKKFLKKFSTFKSACIESTLPYPDKIDRYENVFRKIVKIFRKNCKNFHYPMKNFSKHYENVFNEIEKFYILFVENVFK